MNKILTANHRLKAQMSNHFPRLRNSDNLKVLIFLAITIWIAYFWHSASFGLYSEDMGFVGDAMERNWYQALRHFLHQIKAMPEGRPLQFGLIPLLSFIGLKLGGLQVAYFIGYAILTVNTFLFYTLLKRLSDQQVFAVTGALAFCLFPGYTVQIWLTAALSIQPSLMFLLIASHCYLSGRKNLSYLVILATLFCYETFFPVFLAVPLLKQKWDSRLVRELVKHTLVLGAMFFCVIIIRKLKGESRVAELDTLSAIGTSIKAMLIGPIVSLTTFISRPIETLGALGGNERNVLELWLFLLLCFAGFAWVLSRLKLPASGNVLPLTTTINSKVLRLETTEFFHSLAKLALVGAMMLVLAYPLNIKHSVTVVNDLVSRIHVAAIVGASIFCACICSAILLLAATYRMKRVAIAVIAAFFALLVGFGLMVQQDYQLAWQYQRAFLSDVVKLAPDLDDETILFIDPTGFRDPKYLKAFENGYPMLNSTLMFAKIYPAISTPDKSSKWFNAYILMSPNWKETIIVDGNSFRLNKSMRPVIWGRFQGKWKSKGYRTFASSDLILLEAKNGQLTRRTDPLIIDGKEFPLKEKTTTALPLLENAPIYDYLIKSPDEEPINYIQ